MSEQQFIYDKDIEFEYSGIADKGEWEETEHIFTVKEVCDKLNEQEDTIRKLQNLCGKSNFENAKLRMKIKEQKATIERLKKKMNDCEKFRYEVFKRMEELNK